METTAQPNVTWEHLVASREWNALSPARKVWVTAFLSNNGDALAATRASYKGSEKSIRCMSYELRKNPEILAALEFYHGGVTPETLLAEVRAHLRRAKPGSIAAQKLLAQCERLAFGISNDTETSEVSKLDEPIEKIEHPACKVGDVVLVNNVKYRVTAIDANGRPTDGETL